MQRLPLVLLAGLAAYLGVGPRTARAEAPRTASLSWVRMPGAEDCVATQALAKAVEARLGRATFVSASEAELSVEGRVERAGKAFRAHVEVRDAKGALVGTRDLDGATCDALREPLALAIALMIDPDAASRPPDAPAPPPPPAPVVVEKVVEKVVPTPVIVEKVVEAPARASSLRIEGFVGPAIVGGLVPNVGGALVGGGIATFAPWLGFAGSAGYVFESAVPLEGGATARISALYGGLAYCPVHAFLDRFAFAACAGGQLGALLSRDVGLAQPSSSVGVLVNVALQGRAAVRLLGPFELSIGVTGLVPLVRDTIRWTSADGTVRDAFQPSPVAIIADVGLGARAPF